MDKFLHIVILCLINIFLTGVLGAASVPLSDAPAIFPTISGFLFGALIGIVLCPGTTYCLRHEKSAGPVLATYALPFLLSAVVANASGISILSLPLSIAVLVPCCVIANIYGTHKKQYLYRLDNDLCPDCGYDLQGCMQMGCPECGWGRGME